MTRPAWRGLILVGLFLFALFCIALGQEGYYFSRNGMPVEYLGYFLGIAGFLGVCGVNIWAGGPLDKNDDPIQ